MEPSKLKPGRKVWAAFELEQAKGDVRHANRKHDVATVVSHVKNSKVTGKPSVSVVFERVFYRTSGYQLPAHMASWMMRRANVPCDLLLTQDPSPAATGEIDELYLNVADARWQQPSLTAKQVHEKLVDAATGLPTLAAVKRCLTRLQIERRCPMVHARGAGDILDLVVACMLAPPPEGEAVEGTQADGEGGGGGGGSGVKAGAAGEGTGEIEVVVDDEESDDDDSDDYDSDDSDDSYTDSEEES